MSGIFFIFGNELIMDFTVFCKVIIGDSRW